MDNASKALIMAGGILIGVLIISVSMYIMATARGMARESNEALEASAAESFNRYYQSFPKGGTITGIDVMNIYNKVQDDNWRYNEKKTSYHYIAINDVGGYIAAMEAAEGATLMKETYTYNYETDADGYINSISITHQ